MMWSAQEHIAMAIQSPSPCVRELSAYWIQYGSEKNASLQANVDKHGRLIPVNSGIEHVHDADRGRWGGQRLQADCLQCTVRIQRNNANCLILTTDRLRRETSAYVAVRREYLQDMASADALQALLLCSSQGSCFPLLSDPGIRSAARPNPTRSTPILQNSKLRRPVACWSSQQRSTCPRGRAIRLLGGQPGRAESPADEPVGARRLQFVVPQELVQRRGIPCLELPLCFRQLRGPGYRSRRKG